MQQFTYTVHCDTVLHARPAGQLARAANSYKGTAITITKNCRTVKASQLINLMSLSIANGDEILVTAEGPDEDEAIATFRNLLKGSLM